MMHFIDGATPDQPPGAKHEMPILVRPSHPAAALRMRSDANCLHSNCWTTARTKEHLFTYPQQHSLSWSFKSDDNWSR